MGSLGLLSRQHQLGHVQLSQHIARLDLLPDDDIHLVHRAGCLKVEYHLRFRRDGATGAHRGDECSTAHRHLATLTLLGGQGILTRLSIIISADGGNNRHHGGKDEQGATAHITLIKRQFSRAIITQSEKRDCSTSGGERVANPHELW